MFPSCSAKEQVSIAELRAFRWGLLVESVFFVIKWKMSSEQVHRAAGEAVLQLGQLRSLPAISSGLIAVGQGKTLIGRDSVIGFVRIQTGSYCPGSETLTCLASRGPSRLLGW